MVVSMLEVSEESVVSVVLVVAELVAIPFVEVKVELDTVV